MFALHCPSPFTVVNWEMQSCTKLIEWVVLSVVPPRARVTHTAHGPDLYPRSASSVLHPVRPCDIVILSTAIKTTSTFTVAPRVPDLGESTCPVFPRILNGQDRFVPHQLLKQTSRSPPDSYLAPFFYLSFFVLSHKYKIVPFRLHHV